MKQKWDGRETSVYKKPVNELLERIPSFNRVPYKLHNGGTNKYLDMIIREPLSSDGELINQRLDIPVCIASKQYRLVQHRDVFKALVQAVKLVASDIKSLEATMHITEYGQNMWLSFSLDNHELDQAEQYPFHLEISGL